MIKIRFSDAAAERRALGYLAGRYSFKTYSTGETIVPDAALSALALEGIHFSVQGRETHEQSVSAVRDPAAAAVQ
jgi:hypothetical protein